MWVLENDAVVLNLPEVEELLLSLSAILRVWAFSARFILLLGLAQHSRRLVTFDQLPRASQNPLVVLTIDP